VDTSVLVEGLTDQRRYRQVLQRAVSEGRVLLLSSLVLYEWLRGPRLPAELAIQEALFAASSALPFGPAEAARAAELYRRVPRPRGRETDLGLAACAIEWESMLWTLNPADFRDVPGLRLFTPSAK
jgi:predicted nucleic acid-binding protein